MRHWLRRSSALCRIPASSHLPPWRVVAPPEYLDMSPEERLDWMEANVTEPWCVVHDCTPFLIRILSQHATENEAWGAAASSSKYTTVMDTEKVHNINRRLIVDLELFDCMLWRPRRATG